MAQLDPAWRLVIITGFLGGLTTFYSFSAEVVNVDRLFKRPFSFSRAARSTTEHDTWRA